MTDAAQTPVGSRPQTSPVPLLEERVTLRDTTFFIGHMLPEDAWDLLEVLRPGIGDALDTDISGDGMAAAVRIVSKLSPEIVRIVRDRLFREVTFTTTAVREPATLYGDSAAWVGLTPMHLYEVLARAFCVNFHESSDALLSQFPVIKDLLDDLRQSKRPTSRPSSSTP